MPSLGRLPASGPPRGAVPLDSALGTPSSLPEGAPRTRGLWVELQVCVWHQVGGQAWSPDLSVPPFQAPTKMRPPSGWRCRRPAFRLTWWRWVRGGITLLHTPRLSRWSPRLSWAASLPPSAAATRRKPRSPPCSRLSQALPSREWAASNEHRHPLPLLPAQGGRWGHFRQGQRSRSVHRALCKNAVNMGETNQLHCPDGTLAPGGLCVRGHGPAPMRGGGPDVPDVPDVVPVQTQPWMAEVPGGPTMSEAGSEGRSGCPSPSTHLTWF